MPPAEPFSEEVADRPARAGGGSAAILPPALADYAKHLSLERGLSANTYKAYLSDLKIFLKALGGKDSLQVSPTELSDYLWRLKSDRRLQPRSLFRAMEALKSFYRFQCAEGRLQEDPTRHFKSPHLPERLPRFLSAREVQELLRAGSRAAAGLKFEPVRIRAMLELLYATGARVSEILALKPQDVNFKDGWMRVFGKGGKERLVPVHGRALAALTRFLRLKEERFSGRRAAEEVFVSRGGKKLSRVQFWRDLKSLGRSAGLEQKLHPHLLRHSFASHLLQGGADLRSIQELLGHSSLSTTQIYTHLQKTELKSAHQRHHPRG